MRAKLRGWGLCLLLAGQGAGAQTVIEDHEILAADRPEAWAMNYMAASTLLTAFGETPALAPGRWNAALELGEIPPLSASQRQVGFSGYKTEDLNKSPVFGRLRLGVGLPGAWVAELAYTPPVAINGVRTHDLFALAFGRRIFERGAWSLSARAFGQHGSVRGDITCPAELAGVEDSELNPYGCEAPSRDRMALNYYGIDATAGGGRGAWHWHSGLGVVRTELGVHVDALTYGFLDHTRLSAKGVLRYLAVGGGRDLSPCWRLGAELLYVPISVRRDPELASANEPLTSIRLQLRYGRD